MLKTDARIITTKTALKTREMLLELNDQLNDILGNELNESMYDTERNSIRKIRDANLDTIDVIDRLERVRLI